MCRISQLEMNGFSKILEDSAVGLRELVIIEGWFFKPAALERISLITSRRNSAVAVKARKRCTTAEDNAVPPSVNSKFLQVTNFARFQCFS